MYDTIGSYSSLLLLFLFTSLFGLVYQFVLRSWYYFSDRNVKFVRGVPLLGSTYKSVIGLEPAAISYRRLYDRFPEQKFIGIYDLGGRPSYLLRDPDLIKQLMITDFDHFVNHRFTFGNENDLFTHTLFGMRNSKWRQMRCTVSPAFTGTRMRMMHELMVKSSEQFIATLKETDKIAKIFDSRDLFTRYANDIIATTAFGIEINSMRDLDNDFFKASYSMSEFRFIDGLKFLASLSCPSLVQLLDIRVTGEDNADFLRKIVKENIEKRKKDNIVRNDMIDLLIKARNGQLEHADGDDKTDVGFATTIESNVGKSSEKVQNWTDDDVVAQCLVFILGGLNAIAGTACFMFHELSLNPDIQDKLFAEINGVKEELNGSPLAYESISKMKYLDKVVCETLRRWCPVPFLERTCNRPYVLENNEEKVELQVGDGIFVPTYALHMDDKYFRKPIKFDPERFNDENKGSIQTGTYLPFGIGPRNCIGSRFALMAIKTLAFYLISEFFVDKSYKTQDPLKLKALPLLMDAEKGFFIELRRRQPDRTPYKSQVFT
ncbi:probable cytochrome P450 9f2 [Sitodiplosis mosellana]|uniref:probable cytochrome P450 9f2 n=1 Tax=Sitodiplosis mosellana TaxID=263140 RepID=UPI0024446080|nr:probable cytochrome P450 9f2 [Sitodiplosis mosellana]